MYNHNTMNSHDARRSSLRSGENTCNDNGVLIGISHHQHAQHQHKKRSRSTSTSSASRNALLCILAAALCANTNTSTNTVHAFAPTTVAITTSKSFATNTAGIKSPSALDISSVRAIPHSLIPSPSLADMMGEVTVAVLKETRKQQRQQQQQQKKMSTFATATAATLSSTTTAEASSTTVTTTPTATAPVKSYITNHGNSIVLDEQEVRRRKLEWAGRYTTVEALRQTFGANQNKLWGDMQASTARRLYKTLLPRALLELSQLGVGQLQPQDLAPLAYQARVAAKLYARERCTVPARIGATLFDGFRQWMKYGKFQAHGMTYDQLWEKYADKIVAETQGGGGSSTETDVCLKILERSCVSNASVDQLVLKKHHHRHHHQADKTSSLPDKSTAAADKQQRLLERIHAQLEQDMYQLLLPKSDVVVKASSDQETPAHRQRRRRPWSKRNHVLMVRLLAKQRRLMQQREQQQMHLQEDDRNALRP